MHRKRRTTPPPEAVPSRVRACQVVSIDDLVERGLAANGQSVRVLGYVISFDLATAEVVIEYKAPSCLVVNTLALGDGANIRKGELLQFFGEVCALEGQPMVLHARIMRNVTCLNVELHNRVAANVFGNSS